MRIFSFSIFFILIYFNSVYCNINQYAYKNDKIRGVNLGGWLILEGFIRPSLFEQFSPDDQVVDEYTFTKFLGYEEAKRQLDDHWSSWVTEHDIKKLASYGLNHLRIPVGYWAFEKKPSDPFVMGAFQYLVKAVRWAKKYGLKVTVDLHGAPGSQDGYAFTGRQGPIEWQTDDNIQLTLKVIKNITTTFSHPEFKNTVISIGVLNEPALSVESQFQEYFKEAYNLIREINSDILILYDATIFSVFESIDISVDFIESSKFKRAVLDTHLYNAFTCDFVSMSTDDQLSTVCSNKDNITSTSKTVRRFVGEWSLGTTDCTKWLLGVGNSSRCNYPNGTCQSEDDYLNWTPEYKSYLKQYASAQMNAYEAGIGWTFWNFKTEDSAHWNFMLGVEQGWIPLTPGQRTYNCT